MKRLAGTALLAAFAACSGGQLPEIPTVQVNDGGVRLMTDAKTPFEAYEKAYSDMTRRHLEIRRSLGPNGSRIAVESAAAKIVQNLVIMRGVLVRPEPSTIDPYLAFYGEVEKLAKQGRIGGDWVTKIDQKEKEIKLRFAIRDVEVISEFPKKDETSKTQPKNETRTEEKKGDDLPPPKEKKDETTSTQNKSDEPVKEPKKDTTSDPPPTKDDGVTYRLLFKAWQKSHEDLCAAFKARQNVKERYEEVLESLRGMRKHLSAKDGERLQVYIAFYEKIHEDTKGFTSVPQGAKDEDVLNDLRIVSSGIAKDFDPARRK